MEELSPLGVVEAQVPEGVLIVECGAGCQVTKASGPCPHGVEWIEFRTRDPIADLTVPQAVDLLLAAATRLSEVTHDTKTLPDWQEAVRLLDKMRAAADQAGAVKDALVRHVYLTGEHGRNVIVEGVGPVDITRARDRKAWDERGMIQAVIDRRMEERGGEMPNEPWEVVEWVLEVASVDYGRVTPLRALGLDPDDYCTSTPGRVGVSLPPR